MPPAEITAKADIATSVSRSLDALAAISAQTAARVQTYFVYLQTILDMQWITTQVSVILLLGSIKLYVEMLYLFSLEQVSHAADVSLSAYRELQVQMLVRIGDFSWAIGCEVCYVPNVMQIARSIVLTSHASIGRRFLSAEMSWLKDQDRILFELYNYKNWFIEKPERIYATIDALVTQSAIDMQADGELFTANIIERMGYVIGQQQEQITDLDYKQWQLEDNLANALSQGLENVLVVFTEQFVQWQQNVYVPQVEQFNEQFAGLAVNIAEINDKLLLLDERLNLPGDLLQLAMDLREPVRTEQLKKMSDTILQLYSLDVFTWADLIKSKTE